MESFCREQKKAREGFKKTGEGGEKTRRRPEKAGQRRRRSREQKEGRKERQKLRLNRFTRKLANESLNIEFRTKDQQKKQWNK